MSAGRFVGIVSAALRAIDLLPPDRFAWFGSPSTALPSAVRRRLSPEELRAHLRHGLTERLYRRLYPYGWPRPLPPTLRPSDPAPDREFIEALSAANTGTGTWTPGFVRVGARGEQWVVERRGLALRAPPSEVRAGQDGVEVRLPKEQLGISPGHYLAQSDRPFTERLEGAPDEPAPRLRVYWHLTPAGAVAAMGALTRRLNDAGLAFRFKVLARPSAYVVRDAGVLYVYRVDAPRALATVSAVAEELAPMLEVGVPAFVKPIGVGVGIAEDPEGQLSFGWHRSQVLAEAILRAEEERPASGAAREAAVLRAIEAQGVDLAAPYLEPGSEDRYPPFYTPPPRPSPRAASAEECLAGALAIGERLAASAIWADDRCTWLAPELEDGPGTAEPRRVALGAQLYSGLGGLAWFLAELAAATGRADLARTALAASRQSLARIGSATRAPPLHGLHLGATGTLASAAWAARVLGDDELAERIRGVVGDVVPREPGADRAFDVLGGRAGTVLGLLELGAWLARRDLVDRAAAIGRELLALAEWPDEERCRWRPPARRGAPLLGYSHGASGASHALAELHAATGDPAFSRAARAAASYEELHFAEPDGWPDLRIRRAPPEYMIAWCHGAPGIGLARLRTAALLGEAAHRAQAEAALAITARVAAERIDQEPGSLCHGLISLGAVLLEAPAPPDDLVARIARVALDRAVSPDPTLMLGEAGVGLFLLKAARPSTRTPLLFAPRAAPAV